MDLKQLQAIGALVPPTLFKRKIEFKYPELKPASEWADPDLPEKTGRWLDGSMDAFIRKGSSADAIEVAQASERERPFVAVFRSVCQENGEPVFPTLEDALRLEIWLVMPLWAAINSVSGDPPKNSRPGTNSGANSRSGSAVARSQNGKRHSRSTRKPSGASIAPSAAP
jgi:hypothetical protein